MDAESIVIADGPIDASTPVHRFGRDGDAPAGSELTVHVRSAGGQCWYGLFPPGAYPGVETYGVHHWRSSNTLLVISRGLGYLVDTEDPTRWRHAHLAPITSFTRADGDGLVVVCNHQRLAAYSDLGLAWKTPRLSWDGIRNVRIEDGAVKGEAWDEPWGFWVSFAVDIETGECRGGATFTLA